jgi:Glyoxalase-like domain
MRLALDHLVLAARTLGEGVDWCESTFGLRPEAGGRHVFMSTHNRVFAIGSNAFAQTYFEIIAIDPSLPAPGRPRWFGLDDPAVHTALAKGPRLVQWVARCQGIAAAREQMAEAGFDVGMIEKVERETPHGTLRWQFALRPDGSRLLGGALPALIEWDDVHPTDAMSASGVVLESMRIGGWPDSLLPMLPATIGRTEEADEAGPPIHVRLSSPRGTVALQAPDFTQ